MTDCRSDGVVLIPDRPEMLLNPEDNVIDEGHTLFWTHNEYNIMSPELVEFWRKNWELVE